MLRNHASAPLKRSCLPASSNSGTVFVNDRVCIQTEEKQRVVFVHGVVFAHYSSKIARRSLRHGSAF